MPPALLLPRSPISRRHGRRPRPLAPQRLAPKPPDFDRPAGTIDLDAGKRRSLAEMTLEDEMNRLLGELSNKR